MRERKRERERERESQKSEEKEKIGGIGAKALKVACENKIEGGRT